MGSIRREVFEQLVRRAFDPMVTAYGFELTPQAPKDHIEQRRAAAVYETTSADFARRFSGWATRWDLDDLGCVDLWIEADLTTNRVAVNLEGVGIRELAEGSRTTDTVDATGTALRLKDALEAEATLCAAVTWPPAVELGTAYPGSL